MVRKISQVLLDKTIFGKITAEEFDPYTRYKYALEDQKCINFLNYDIMKTKTLYDRERLQNFIQLAKQPNFNQYKLLGNIITLELTMKRANLLKYIDECFEPENEIYP